MDYFLTILTGLLYPLILGAGIFSSIRLLSLGTKEVKIANGLLVMLLFVLMLPMWNAYVKLVLPSDALSFGWPFKRSYWLIAPLMYLYVKEIFSKSPRRQLYFVHFIPFAAVVILEKIALIDKTVFFKISLVFWVLITLSYIVLLVSTLVKARKKYQQLHSATLAVEFKWILGLLFGLMMFVVLDVFLGVYILMDMPRPKSLSTGLVFVRSLYVVAIVSYTLYYQLVLKSPLDLSVELLPKKNPLNQSRLTDSVAKSLASTLDRKMEENALFSSPSLNLKELAAHLGVTTHQLSELFNVHMNTNFYRYVNVKRINHAKSLLSENPEKSIVDISLLCGYSSKTTFYDNFKKICSMTPKEYRENPG